MRLAAPLRAMVDGGGRTPWHPVVSGLLSRTRQGPSHETLDSQPRRSARLPEAGRSFQVTGSLSVAL